MKPFIRTRRIKDVVHNNIDLSDLLWSCWFRWTFRGFPFWHVDQDLSKQSSDSIGVLCYAANITERRAFYYWNEVTDCFAPIFARFTVIHRHLRSPSHPYWVENILGILLKNNSWFTFLRVSKIYLSWFFFIFSISYHKSYRVIW